MAAINIDRATSTLTSPGFAKSAVLIVVGSLLAQLVTSYMQDNIRDIQMRGGDAVYSVVAALLALLVLPGAYGRNIALGASATAVRTIARDFGVL